jgi:hypothetical protein
MGMPSCTNQEYFKFVLHTAFEVESPPEDSIDINTIIRTARESVARIEGMRQPTRSEMAPYLVDLYTEQAAELGITFPEESVLQKNLLKVDERRQHLDSLRTEGTCKEIERYEAECLDALFICATAYIPFSEDIERVNDNLNVTELLNDTHRGCFGLAIQIGYWLERLGFEFCWISYIEDCLGRPDHTAFLIKTTNSIIVFDPSMRIGTIKIRNKKLTTELHEAFNRVKSTKYGKEKFEISAKYKPDNLYLGKKFYIVDPDRGTVEALIATNSYDIKHAPKPVDLNLLKELSLKAYTEYFLLSIELADNETSTTDIIARIEAEIENEFSRYLIIVKIALARNEIALAHKYLHKLVPLLALGHKKVMARFRYIKKHKSNIPAFSNEFIEISNSFEELLERFELMTQ